MSIPWAMQMKAVSIEEPARLVQTLTGAILGCGGWVLSRGANDTGPSTCCSSSSARHVWISTACWSPPASN